MRPLASYYGRAPLALLQGAFQSAGGLTGWVFELPSNLGIRHGGPDERCGGSNRNGRALAKAAILQFEEKPLLRDVAERREQD